MGVTSEKYVMFLSMWMKDDSWAVKVTFALIEERSTFNTTNYNKSDLLASMLTDEENSTSFCVPYNMPDDVVIIEGTDAAVLREKRQRLNLTNFNVETASWEAMGWMNNTECIYAFVRDDCPVRSMKLESSAIDGFECKWSINSKSPGY